MKQIYDDMRSTDMETLQKYFLVACSIQPSSFAFPHSFVVIYNPDKDIACSFGLKGTLNPLAFLPLTRFKAFITSPDAQVARSTNQPKSKFKEAFEWMRNSHRY